MEENKINSIENYETDLKEIIELFVVDEKPYQFFIPDYQRGYRWTKANVKALLNDINEIKDGAYYCLQPVVVKKNKDRPNKFSRKAEGVSENLRVATLNGEQLNGAEEAAASCDTGLDNNDEYYYEVIDGQQRLTTIYLIACAMKDIGGIKNSKWPIFEYESRDKTTKLLEKLAINDNEARKRRMKGEQIESPNLLCDDDKEFKELFEDYEEDIDVYHVYQSCDTIRNWLKDYAAKNKNDLSEFFKKVFRQTRIIWYEVDENSEDTPTEVFTRLNKGKIPLDDSELIKAMFLKSNKKKDETETDKIQNKVAIEWDQIERELQDDKFWYFLSNDKVGDNRINFIFKLMYETKEDNKNCKDENTEECEDEQRKIYEYFAKELLEKDSWEEKSKIWEQITDWFYRIKGWYKKRELYHYIGYLVAIGEMKFIDIYKECLKDKTYSDCIWNLKNKIYELVIEPKEAAENKEPSEYNYDKNSKIIRNILLLHNILTILKNKNSVYFFPFDKYKDENWDIEHISPCNPERGNRKLSKEEKIKWFKGNMQLVLDILNSEKANIKLTEKEENLSNKIDKFNKDLNELNNSEDDMGIDIYNFKTKEEYLNEMEKKYTNWELSSELETRYDDISENVYNVFNSAIKREDEKDDENRLQNTIANLALLNSNINRSYGNDLFPAKRNRIIEEDKTKSFIPLCTKHAFLKYYSTSTSRLWTKDDAEAYKKDIDAYIEDFVKELEAKGDKANV